MLASASPRRRDLLAGVGLLPEVAPADVDETIAHGEPVLVACERLARDKARAAARGRTRGVVLAGDTIVVADGEALGKPVDRADAEAMLSRLSGRTHQVASSAALLHVQSARLVAGVDVSDVEFSSLDDEQLQRYLAGNEWCDKAGAYAIQGDAAAFARLVTGRLDTVIGLSIGLVERLVHRLAGELSR